MPFIRKNKKNSLFVWNETDTSLLKQVFNKIKEETLLHYPDFSKEFVLETDACDIGCGAVLKQENNLIGFFGFKFNPSERNYTIMEKEALGITRSIQHFRTLIFNSKIIVKTDNANNIFMQNYFV